MRSLASAIDFIEVDTSQVPVSQRGVVVPAVWWSCNTGVGICYHRIGALQYVTVRVVQRDEVGEWMTFRSSRAWPWA